MYNQNDSERRWRGGDVLDGNVMRGPEKRDKKVGGEWARGYKAFYHRNKLAGTRGGI